MVRALAAAVAVIMCAAPANAAKAPLPSFRSPTGNIRCFDAVVLRCQIAQADYATTLQATCMARSSVDWHGFELGATGKGGITCSGGILYDPSTQTPHYPLLPYGTTWRHAGFTCASAVTGITCRNRAGHGVFLSRRSWRGF